MFISRVFRTLVIKMPAAPGFYAVRRGKQTGVFTTWKECEAQIKGFAGARYKKFPTQQEADDFVAGKEEKSEKSTSKSSSDKKRAAGDNESQQKGKSDDAVPAKSGKKDELSLLKNCFDQIQKATGTISDSSKEVSKLLPESSAIANIIKANQQIRTYTTEAESHISKLQSNADADPKPAKRPRTDSGEAAASSDATDSSCPVVYTDGACQGNGQAGSQAGIGVYWGPNNPNNLAERLGGRQTNNRAEIHAAIRAIRQAKKMGHAELTIKTDSQFMINSVTQWIAGWKKRNWQLSSGGPVKNKEDFVELDEEMQGINVNWVHVKGHSGDAGNDAADALAVEGARKPSVD